MLIFREGHAFGTNRAEALLLALYDISIYPTKRRIIDVISVMHELMRKRKSGLNSVRRRNELKSPAFP